MATSTRVCSAVFLLSGVLAILAACDKESSPQPAPTPLTAVVARIEINGPRTVAPGETATFTATAFFTDGSSRDVTSEARWRSNSFPIFLMDGPGRGKAGGRGDVTITADLNGITSTVQVVVVPVGTYRLSGVVRVSNVAGGFVAGAQVQVLDGPERLETLTNAQGQYVLFGVPGTARIRITRAGYETSEQTVQLTQHQLVDFSLSLSEALPDFSGTYTLRISLATPCGTSDPGPEFRDRTYTATITQTGLSLAVRLTGAEMVVSSGRGDRFTGTAEPTGATFNIDEDFYGYFYPEVVERLPSGTHLVVGGVASTKRVAEGLVGTLNGSFSLYAGRPGQTRPFGGCWSPDIRFALLK
jgi:Carboxypeptidase regulatory-like domain